MQEKNSDKRAEQGIRYSPGMIYPGETAKLIS
jgi:hypothetical protein